MSPDAQTPAPPTDSATTRVARVVRHYPHAPYVAPFFAFLLLMLLDRVVDPAWKTYTYGLRCGVGLWLVWLFREHLPRFGRAHLLIAVPVGLLTTLMWVEVHHVFAGCTHQPCDMLRLLGIDYAFPGFDWYRRWAMFDGNEQAYFVPSRHYQSAAGLWSFLAVRIGGAAIAVPIIEELFWRAFLLRFLIDWDRWDELPMAQFQAFSFVVCCLLSAVSHQPQWEVGILCWVIYNVLFYWKKSLTCCMVTHGVTNLTLYIYVYWAGDWRFW